jgi:carboxypeptidase Taq
MKTEAAYEELIQRTRESALLSSSSELLSWDEQIYMPPGGAEYRGQQLALLAGLHHERETNPRMGELLAVLEGSSLISDPLSPAAVNVRELRRAYDRLTRLPRRLVEELAGVVPVAQQAWVSARQRADFAVFHPWLEKMVALKRQEAEALGYEKVAYDALLDEYEPGVHSEDLALLFETLRQELVPLVAELTYNAPKPRTAVLRREFPIERQRMFSEEVAAALGFDFQRGRLDTTLHPFFSSIGPGDCRITTRFTGTNFCDSFFGVLHEVGHGLYEQGLDPAHFDTPIGESASVGIHESQARLWENAVGRSRAFWHHFLPRARRLFPEALRHVEVDEFHAAINRVEPSPLRVGADEATYDLHILIRFELERALIDGNLSCGEIPAAWNEKYRHYLGIVPTNDAEGCLQDAHWSEGLIGYFPTYTLGNLYAAQMYECAVRAMPDLEVQFARGDFNGLLGWLRNRLYQQGQRFRAAALIEHITGSAPHHRAFVAALRGKYAQLGWTGRGTSA